MRGKKTDLNSKDMPFETLTRLPIAYPKYHCGFPQNLHETNDILH
jgi:hypothetical protein